MEDWLVSLVLIAIAFVPTTYLLTNVLLSRRRSRSQPGDPLDPATVTAVVPVYHESPALFAECVTSIAAQGCRWIVVGDAVDAPYRGIVEQAGGEFVRLPAHGGKKAALAEGVRRVTTPFVLFVDADTVIPADAVRRMGAYFRPNVGGVGANLSVRDTGTGVAAAAEFVERGREVVLRAMSSRGNVLYLDGACMMYRTEQVRGYILSDEFQHLEVAGRPSRLGDDWLLTDHVLALGLTTVKAYDVRAITSPKDDVSSFVRQNVRWSRSSWIRLGRYLRGAGPEHPGLFYRLELAGTYALPILALGLAIARAPMELSMFSRTVVDPALSVLSGAGAPVRAAHRGLDWLWTVSRVQLAFGIVGTVAFVGTVARTIEPQRRLRTVAYGALGTAVLLATSIYGLATFWVAPASASRSVPSPPRLVERTGRAMLDGPNDP